MPHNPYVGKVYGRTALFTPDKVSDCRKYTFYWKDERYHLHIGEWIHPHDSIVSAHGILTPADCRDILKARTWNIYASPSCNWVGIYPYFADYVAGAYLRSYTPIPLTQMYPINADCTEWESPIVTHAERSKSKWQ